MKQVSLAIVCVLVAAAIAAGCSKDETELMLSPAGARAIEAAPQPLDKRSLVDLAQALRVVEIGDPYDQEDGYADIERSFEGKRYRWQMFLIPALCSESQCNALPFKDGGRAQGIVQGWMPRLALSPAQRATLLETCGDTPQCPFTVEARLDDLVASTDAFTKLALEDVILVEAAEVALQTARL